MPDYFSQYSATAAGFAAQYGVPQSVGFGLIQQESGWNPFAVGDNGAAIGFGQLHAGAAADVGVNRFDPVQNLQGSMAYLGSMIKKTGGDVTLGLAYYNQGAGATGTALQKGLAYANSVLDKAKGFLGGGTGSDVANGAKCAAGDPLACASLGGSLLGLGGDANGCGTFDFICKLQKWVSESNFFTRLALATLALLLVLGGLYLMKERN
jgi:hypothetical protein